QSEYAQGTWRDVWAGSTGPRFYGLLMPEIYSHRFFFGIRFEKEFWGQMLEAGYPASPPSTLELPGSIGLVVAAHLDMDWFTGLPFALEDTTALLRDGSDTSYLRENKTTRELVFVRRCRERRFPHTTIVWHATDDLFPRSATEEDAVSRWMK